MADLADAFEAMAARIRAIDPQDFNGAVVVVAPDGGGFTMLLQGTRDETLFWSTAKSKMELSANDFAMRGVQPGFGTGYR